MHSQPPGRSLRGQLPLLLQQGLQQVGSLHGCLQGAQHRAQRAHSAPHRHGQGRAREPSLTSYCLRRLLMLSSFLSTAAFTLTWIWGAEHPSAKQGAGPCPRGDFSPSPSPVCAITHWQHLYAIGVCCVVWTELSTGKMPHELAKV